MGTPEPTGYLSPHYARSLAEFGEPCAMPASGAWFLSREIADGGARDLMGCYPVLACETWGELASDRAALEGRVVSASAVADPFGAEDPAELHAAFPDLVRPYKEHFVVDLEGGADSIGSKHHRYYTKRALRELEIEIADDPPALLDDWTALYAELVQRHDIRGIRAFSREAFAIQLAIPGLVAVVARHEGRVVGAHLWYVQNGVATSHLAASSERGYELMASYGLYRGAIDHFAATPGVRWMNMGAGAGVSADADDGLTRFKRGWSTGTRTVHFCGRILDRERYSALAESHGTQASDYFPAYRAGEFA